MQIKPTTPLTTRDDNNQFVGPLLVAVFGNPVPVGELLNKSGIVVPGNVGIAGKDGKPSDTDDAGTFPLTVPCIPPKLTLPCGKLMRGDANGDSI